MYCTNCGKALTRGENYCSKCGSSNTPEKKRSVDTNYSNQAGSVIKKVLIAAIAALLIGFISYPISNSVLGINKENLTRSDFNFERRVGADNALLRRQGIESKSVENAMIVTGVSFFIVLAFMFVAKESDDEATND